MQVDKEEVMVKGKTTKVNSLQVNNKKIVISGKLFKTARIKVRDEYFEDVEDPESLVKQLRKSKVKADIFTFWQRLPDTKPKYNYYMEWDNLAAIPIKNYDHWWKNQIKKKIRENVRKALRRGVIVKTVPFNDKLIEGITNIYNETPIRQGMPFIHYGKDFETVKKDMSDRLNLSEFIGAYYQNELIGFIKLIDTGRFIRTSGTISKIEHRDKSPMNALIAEAVKVCYRKKASYLVYGKFVYGKKGYDTLSDFKRHNGFERIDLPRYYIPLTIKGKLILKLHIHHGIIGMLPRKLIVSLIFLRKLWYTRKLRIN